MPTPEPSPDADRERERWLWRFEQAWQSPTPPRLEDYLAGANGNRTLVEELVAIDLEYRWRARLDLAGVASASGGPRLEAYLQRYAVLGRPEQLSLKLIGREYEARCSWGQRPPHAEYRQRFPAQGDQLLAELQRVDAELAAEFITAAPRPVAASPASAPVASLLVPPATAADLVVALRRWQLLPPARLADLARATGEPRMLARQLIEKGWLTPYQVNQLLQGRGEELVLGPYLILDRLGAGGTGQVFRVLHQQAKRVEALKLILKDKLSDKEIVQRFHREVKLTSQLTHPNIVRALDAGQLGATHFMTMEYVEGTDLAKLVKQRGPLPVAEACGYIRQAALGLQHAHERGLVHRDIKPHNLLLGRDGVVKVLDLGLARLRHEDAAAGTLLESGITAGLTPEGAAMMGTPDYLAPEQAVDFHAADIRADIYSLGCTLFFLLTGRPPFPGNTLAQKLLRHQQAEPQPLRQARPDAPANLERVLARMLAKQPARRYQTPAEVAHALAALSGMAGAAPEAVSDSSRLRWHWWRWLAAGLLLVGALLIFWLWPRSTGTPEPAPIASQLAMLLRLDELTGRTASDASGHGHTGTLLSAGDGPHWSTGRIGGGLRFNRATQDRVRVASFPYAPANAFTVAFWFKADDLNGTGSQYLFSQGATSYPHHLNVVLFESGSGSAGVLRTMFRDADDGVSHSALDIAGKTTVGRWHHYALTVGASGAQVYVDGVQQAASRQGGGAFQPSADIGLGCRLFGPQGAQHFAGSLDDVRVYSRTLGAAEVATLAHP
ncbi:MAG: protein kinase [Planctomycetia bacterium]|nr:protein kinase [Planctomycetia bacterium]